MENVLLRKPSVRRLLGDVGNSTIYDWAKKGLLVPPVRYGSRASGWPSREIDAITKARIAGATDEQIRTLVKRLVAERTEVDHLALPA